jgi:DNA-binding protein H-NS
LTEDLDSMSREELQRVIAEAKKRIAAAERAIEKLDARRRAEARRAAEAAAREYGFELAEVLAEPGRPSRGGGKPRAKGVIRYRNPADPRQTWTGNGRKPNWIRAALAEGRDLSEFAV